MAPDYLSVETRERSSPVSDTALILPIVSDSGNRRVLIEWIDTQEGYDRVEATSAVLTAEYDCLIVDQETIHDRREQIIERSNNEQLVLPVVLLVEESEERRLREKLRDQYPELWETITAVIPMPISEYRITDRIETLLKLRRQSRNIAEEKKHKRQLKVLDRVLRHNINNNMNVVKGYAEIIQEQADDDFEQHARRILTNSERLIEMADKERKITEFLSDTPPLDRVDIERTLERVVDRIQADFAAVDVSMRCPEDIHAIASIAIEDVFDELVTNAVVHSDRDEPTVDIAVEQTDDTVTISVADENQPIHEGDREVLTDGDGMDALHHGSGLGLWLVKLIVGHANGSAAIESNEPRGNIVHVQLPLEPRG